MSPSRPYHESHDDWLGGVAWWAEYPEADFCADYPTVRHFDEYCTWDHNQGRSYHGAVDSEWDLPVCKKGKPVDAPKVCSSCNLALPATGVCGFCGGSS